MSFDPKVYRNSKDGIGGPADAAATNSTEEWTLVSLAKGLYQLLGGTGIVVAGVSTAAKQDTGNATLTAIDGHVDGIEGLLGTTNTTLSTIDGHVDGLETAVAATNTTLGTLATQTTAAAILAKIIAAPATEAKQDAAITQETAINTVLGTTAGAAITTSIAGTIQGYLRGIVSLLVSGITVATHAVTQSGTWTVQPGNTANTTAWKVDGSAVTQPVSIASVPSHPVTNAGTFAVQAAEADGANVTLGAKADAKSTATDTTAISAMSVWKQISASIQAAAASLAGVLSANTEGQKATYSASFSTITAASAATDIAAIIGSATKTIRVLRISLSGYATANTSCQAALLKRSTANTGGTSADATSAPHDSASAAGTAILRRYTANPTLGTAVGYVRAAILTCRTLATSSIAPEPLVWDFTTRNGQGVVLRGVAQSLCVSLESNTVSGGVISVDVEWTEE